MAKIARNLLIVEDDIGIQNQLKWSLDDFDVSLTDNHDDAITAVRATEPAIVLLDLGLPPDPGGASEGLRTLRSILEIAPATKIIIITGNDDKAHAVDAVGSGAYDFYNKPIDADALAQVVSRAERLYQLERENKRLQLLSTPSALDGVIAVCEPMVKVCRDIEKIAPMNISALLLGESGTGKELLAKALHELSPRAHNEMVSINCAAIPENLLESELFGYEKGAFTGAAKQTRGKLEYAHGGTLFLDEIGDLPLALQSKLLRFLQEKTLERVGGRTSISVDTRIVCATHKDINQMIEEKLFREDLYYRLAEVTINIPALRDRQADVQIIAKSFLGKFAKEMGKPAMRFNNAALNAMSVYAWPGNIRELENRVKRATVMCDGKLVSSEDLDLDLDLDEGQSEPMMLNLKQVRESAERNAIINAVSQCAGNISKTAKLLGVSRPTLYDLLSKHEIQLEK